MKIEPEIINERVVKYLDTHKDSLPVDHLGTINSFTSIIYNAYKKRNLFGEPLPWIHSAINMPYLNAANAFVLGLSLPAIDTMTLCLEFTFRLAIEERENSSGHFYIDTTKLTKSPSWKNLFKEKTDEIYLLIPNDDDRQWWEDCVNLRNKINHFDITYLISNYKSMGYLSGMDVQFVDGDYSNSATWGAFYHRLIYALADDFIPKANSMLKKLIEETEWPKLDEENMWASHKSLYDDFFSIDWRPLHLQLMLDIHIEKCPGTIKQYYSEK